ncbi:Mediator complex [Macleaya cordata]|uniref:Mediator of RNA polymerase II transcription subunit 31 n=1 Tax=Macleaya cordata TaxID=56857 RepID=A0A200RAR5_MACCD|nr:Mediator complex [Macleaya cordata]
MASGKEGDDAAQSPPTQVELLKFGSVDPMGLIKCWVYPDIVIKPGNLYKDPDDGRQRFLLELEFVQCLANPTYIHYLAQNRYFEDEAFIGYLKYLQYWQRPEYIKFIMYPHCLYFLELLQNANFRNAMAHPGSKELAHRQQFFFWKNFRNNRLKHIVPRPLPEPIAAPPASVPPPATLVTAASVAPPAAPALSPMHYAMPPGSSMPKTDIRNIPVDRRKRKWLSWRVAYLSSEGNIPVIGMAFLSPSWYTFERGSDAT